MNAKTTRIYKEARALFWPWCAVMIAGLLPLASGSHDDWTEALGVVGFFGGIPLLATLPFGHEFQHRTLSLLLSQPVSRMRIWGEKLSVSTVAVLSAAVVFYYGWAPVLRQDPNLGIFAGGYLITVAASATFWTLFARSTLGGIMLSGLALDIFLFCFLIAARLLGHSPVEHWDEIFGPKPSPGRTIATLCYAGVMFWLGRRKLARFQLAEGAASGDLLMAGPNVMPEALAASFRCRPTEPILNLIRKELRLLRPLWLISLLSALAFAALVMLNWVPKPGPSGYPPVAWAMLILYPLGAGILAGSLSLGEERTSGTHSWHLTLPVSARRQWLIKLLMALFAGCLCGAVLPFMVVISGGLRFGLPFMHVFVLQSAGMVWVLEALILCLASFWCASAVKGTARAAMWVFPVLIGLGFAGDFGGWVADRLMELVVSRFDVFAAFAFTNAVSNVQYTGVGANFMLIATLFLVPMLLVVLIQSYRLFRIQVQDGTLFVIRNLIPLAITAFLCSFSLLAFFFLVDHAKREMWTMFHETHEAIEKVQPGTPNLDAMHPLQLTGEDLAKTALLSERTRRWLRNSTITVAPDKPQTHPGGYCCSGNSGSTTFPADRDFSLYLATIHLASGSNCTLSFGGKKGYGVLGGVCK